jgi:isoquinoline 1-oxidoreductase beta subunit
MPLLRGEAALNGWIKISEDGTVTVAMPRSEMGQGVHTTLATLVAEELDVPLARVRLENAPDDKIFGNVVTLPDGLPFHPDDQGALAGSVRWLTTKLARELGLQITGGSTSMRDAWLPMREAGASARAMLVAAAAKQWGVDPAECATGDGMVRTGAGGKVRSLAYGALAAAAAGQTPGKVTLKLPAQFTLIGRAQPRTDSRAKSDGSALFGLDVRPAGLQYAAVAMAPSLGAKLVRVDAAAAKAMPGVVRVVDFSKTAGAEGVEGVAVIATSWWQARQAVDKLQLVWDAGTPVSSAGVAAQLKDALDKQNGYAYYERGDLPAPDAGRRVQAEYSAPYLAHATMEPINCTAQVGGRQGHGLDRHAGAGPRARRGGDGRRDRGRRRRPCTMQFSAAASAGGSRSTWCARPFHRQGGRRRAGADDVVARTGHRRTICTARRRYRASTRARCRTASCSACARMRRRPARSCRRSCAAVRPARHGAGQDHLGGCLRPTIRISFAALSGT